MSGQTITICPETVQLLLQRGRMRMVQAVLNEAEIANAQKMYDFWHGFADCAAALLNGRAEVMALHDQASILQGAVQTALARLPDHCERLSFAKMESLLRAQGIDFASYAVTDSDIDAVVQLQDGVSPVVKLDDKHAVAAVDVGDGGKVHGYSPDKTAIVAQGGAA